MNATLGRFLLLTVLILSVRCEDESASPENYFSFNNDITPLEYGTIRSIQTQEYPESEEVVFEWDIFLSSGNLVDKKHWVRFILNSSSLEDVPVGTYTYDEEYKEHEMADFSFYITSIMRNAETESEQAKGDLAANTDFTSGTVTVERRDDTYSISFSITLDNGDVCEGRYTGKLTRRDPVVY